MNTVGIDIGGANLKYADANGAARSREFPLWRHPERLAKTLAEDLAQFGQIDSLPVTMTGELADCFIDRAEGVKQIVTHVCRAAQSLAIDNVAFYGVDGHFRDAEMARCDVDQVASANWHALASFVGRDIAANATLVDIGSTTTDIIPIRGGRVITAAQTDHDRLVEGSLVYIGCHRTPVCAVVDHLEFRGLTSGVMNEVFATIDDARLVLGTVDANRDDHDTADGQPRTALCAAGRLARMIGLDRRSVNVQDARGLAAQIVDAAGRRIARQLATLADPCHPIVLSGHGPDLLDAATRSLHGSQLIVTLAEHVGAVTARCAPAFALARLYFSSQRTDE